MPCPKCEAPILGNPTTCPECGHPLGGAVPPVASAFARAPVTLPPDEPSFIEHNQLADPVQVVPEPVEGLIDARLFGAYVPAGVDAPPIEGLEVTVQSVGDVPDDKVPELEHTSHAGQPARANLADASPVDGLIDSRLFGAYVPAGVDAPLLEGLEVTSYRAFEPPAPRAATAPGKKGKAREADDAPFEGFCPHCFTNVKTRICPLCGNPARPRGG